MILDTVKKRIQQNGWMSIRELFFDNGLSVRILETDVNIAYDKTENMFYWLQALSYDESASYNKHFICDRDREFSTFFCVKAVPGDLLFGADFILYEKMSQLDKVGIDPAVTVNPEVEDMRSTRSKATVKVAHGNPLPYIMDKDETPVESTAKEGVYLDTFGTPHQYRVSEAHYLADGTYITVDDFKGYHDKNKKFKQYLADAGYATLGNLI